MARRTVKNDLNSIIAKKDEKLKELNNKLKEAERLADLGKMSSAVAHELRNPLGVIRLATYTFAKENWQ